VIAFEFDAAGVPRTLMKINDYDISELTYGDSGDTCS
jgi:hypothetical protein